MPAKQNLEDLDWVQRQIAYYRARASEYDKNYSARSNLEGLFPMVRELPVHGEVLELACGTGQWTRIIAPHAASVTALDAAPEMLGIARRRLRGRAVRFVEADVFTWVPEHRYDTVFFAFWLTHVPPHRLSGFWDVVDAALRQDGAVVFLDDALSKADIEEWVEVSTLPLVRRRLADGTEHLAVKALYTPYEIAASLRSRGWHGGVWQPDRYHLCGIARPKGPS